MFDDEKSKIKSMSLENDLKKPAFIGIFLMIFFIGFLFRIYYLPYGIPITLDGLIYFWYANDIALFGSLPTDYSPANNGWPIFLSIFFQMLNSENFLDFMVLQRIVTAVLSSLTIIPIYYICRKFFTQKFALIGSLLFSFEPRIIQNSILGISEPLFILLITTSIACLLSYKKPINFIAFPLIAFGTLVRSEAVILIIPFSVLYIIKYRKLKHTSYELPLLVLLFFLIILPMSDYKTNVNGTDAIFSRIPNFSDSSQVIENNITSESSFSKTSYELQNIISMMGWASIPIFLFFVPFGIYTIFRHRNFKNYSIGVILSFLAIPAIYAISFLPDTKYLYVMYPLLCLISVFSIKKIVNHFTKKNYALITIVTIILISSITFLEIKKFDLEHEEEVYKITKIISEKVETINQFTTESGYLPIVGMSELEEFPISRGDFIQKESSVKYCFNIHSCERIIPVKTDNIIVFLQNAEKRGITHLIIDENQKRRAIFNEEIFKNEDGFPYLKKIYDSKENNFNYHLKIFEIDFEKLDDVK